MQGAHGELHVLILNQDRGFDLAGADHLDVDVFCGQCFKHQAGHAGVRAHTDTDDRDLGDFVVRNDLAGANSWADLALEQGERACELVAVKGA